MQRINLIQYFLKRGFQVNPDALEELLAKQIDCDKFLDYVEQISPETVVISKALLLRYQASFDPEQEQLNSLEQEVTKTEETELPRITDQLPAVRAKKAQLRIDIITQVPFRTESQGELIDFLTLFKDRYARLRQVLLVRPEIRSAIEIRQAMRHPEGGISVIGMIEEVRTTPQGAVMISLEDGKTGDLLTAIISPKNQIAKEARFLFTDTVIGIIGVLKNTDDDDKPRKILFGKEIIKPGVPKYAFRRGDADELGCAAIIGDLHVGSKHFDETLWKKFLKFLNQQGKEPKYKAIAARISHLLIPGDLVDGVGIFPNQEDELEITNIYDQYKCAAELMNDIPQDIQIVIAPGNHDASRQALPQQVIPKRFCENLISMKNVEMVANPSLFKLGPRKILMYHGQGLERVIQQTKATFDQPHQALIEVLEYRHLFPIYGTKTAIAPEHQDYLIIEELPEIVVTGHLHVGKTRVYQGLRLTLSGTFEQASSWLKALNIRPTVGLVPIVDLASGELYEFQV